MLHRRRRTFWSTLDGRLNGLFMMRRSGTTKILRSVLALGLWAYARELWRNNEVQLTFAGKRTAPSGRNLSRGEARRRSPCVLELRFFIKASSMCLPTPFAIASLAWTRHANGAHKRGDGACGVGFPKLSISAFARHVPSTLGYGVGKRSPKLVTNIVTPRLGSPRLCYQTNVFSIRRSTVPCKSWSA